MIYSMTGFGRGEARWAQGRFVVEIRAVNHRYLDISVRMPRRLAALEDALRKLISASLSRGKVEVYVTEERADSAAGRLALDLGLAEAYYNALRNIGDRLSIPADIALRDFLAMPDVIRPLNDEASEDVAWAPLGAAAKEALDKLGKMRAAEGARLVADMQSKIAALRGMAEAVEARAPLVVEQYRQRLQSRVAELLGAEGQAALDPGRLETEVAIFADRSAIDEELVRLKSHLEQADALCASNEPIGRKMDFLAQEINREVNTIASKSNDTEIRRVVVDAKAEVEKIREQIQNLE